MKSELLGMLSLTALSLGMVSCSSEDIETTGNILTQNAQKYGTHSSEVNLYFGGNKIVGTRACDVSGNQWGAEMPKYPTEEEKAGILDYVCKNPEASVEWPGYTCYFVQHVISANNKYSYKDRNNTLHDNIDGSTNLNELQIKENNGNYTHVNNFNSGKCENAATHNAALMTQGFQGARAHDSYGNTDVDNWRLYYWKGNYYLGIDYMMVKDEGKIEPDGTYDDWIVKIIPGKGETPVVPSTPDPNPAPKPEPTPTPTPEPTPVVREGEVEFDIHQQEHKDWNEIKTSIHVRDTAAVHVFLPIPMESQAVADDFDIRTGNVYQYVESFEAKFEFAGKEFSFPVEINHTATGINILIDCTTAEAKEALKLARGVFDDGITFEIHSYVNPDVATEQIWNWLKTVKLPSTKTSQWPQDGDISTHVRGQVSSAYHMDEMIHFDERPVHKARIYKAE
ncbi:putative uncharacterized protein [Prevotella sp. CAG:1092]|nr:putative uncharacterized protein [Prevotella sp. CAG:1092]